MVRVRRTSAPLLAAAVVAAVAVACSLGSGAYAAAEQEAVGAGAGAGVDDLWLRQPPITRGLSFDFYKRSCPRAESIVRHFVRDAVRKDVGLAAGLLRLHFHDCFVQGCDASVLLDGSAPPNLTLRPSAFKAINDIRDRLERECRGAVVSCSDILALAATPCWPPAYRVPLGRRDSPQFATQQDVLSGLPAPTSTVPSLLNVVGSLGLDATDLVALSGGRALHLLRGPPLPAPRPDHELGLPRQAEADVPTDRRTPLDVRTPDVFDNKYCVNLVNREGLFVSDQDLQRNFFNQFGVSMVKMGQIKVLTGGQGQVRRNCSARNPGTVDGNLGLEWGGERRCGEPRFLALEFPIGLGAHPSGRRGTRNQSLRRLAPYRKFN
ncbi:hypothetical protein ZWY2020_026386 [Hordeum vulgare]|nr:hypothetical protein ZWY2020_026386 [Hordeum vulgare]